MQNMLSTEGGGFSGCDAGRHPTQDHLLSPKINQLEAAIVVDKGPPAYLAFGFLLY